MVVGTISDGSILSLGSLFSSVDRLIQNITDINAGPLTDTDRENRTRAINERQGQFMSAVNMTTQGFRGLISAFGPLTSALSMFQNKLIGVLKTQFQQSIEAETADITSVGSIQAASKNILTFDESYTVFQDTKQELAKVAATLPGKTADYVQTFKLSVDSIAQGITETNKDISKADLVKEIKDKGIEVSKLLTLQAKTTGTSAAMSSKVFGQFLSGQLNLQADIFEANPVFKQKAIDEAVKLGAKKSKVSVDLSGLTIDKRYKAFVNALRESISAEMLSSLENSFDGVLEGLKSVLADNTSGILGFNRRFDAIGFDAITGKEINTLFGALSSVTRPVLKGVTSFLNSLIRVFDPLETLGKTVLKVVQNWSNNVNTFGSIFASQLDYNLSAGRDKLTSFQESFSLALKNAFGIEIKPVDINVEKIIGLVSDGIQTMMRSLGKELQIERSREMIKAGLITFIKDIVVPYVKLLGEVVGELFKEDPLVGTIAGGIIFAPLVSAVGSLVQVLIGSAQLLNLAFGKRLMTDVATGTVTSSNGLGTVILGGILNSLKFIISSFGAVFSSLGGFLVRIMPFLGVVASSIASAATAIGSAIAAGFAAMLPVLGIVGLAVLIAADLYLIYQNIAALVAWAEYRPTWLGGKDISQKDANLTDGTLTKEQVEKSQSAKNRRLIEKGLDPKTGKPMSEAEIDRIKKMSGGSTNSGTTNKNITTNQENNDNKTGSTITNNITVNTTQDAETVAQQLINKMQLSLASGGI
jgi:hypothetical protein